MKKVLIYCSNIHGHRQVYSNVMAQWALERDLFVYLVYEEGQFSPYINFYQGKRNIKLIKTKHKESRMQELVFALRLQKKLKTDIFFLPDGMLYIDSLYELSKSQKNNNPFATGEKIHNSSRYRQK